MSNLSKTKENSNEYDEIRANDKGSIEEIREISCVMNKDGIVVEEKEVKVGNTEIEKNVHKESVNLSLEKNKGVFRCSDMEFDEFNVIFGSMSKEDVEKEMEIDEQNKSLENEDFNVRNGSPVKISDTNDSTNRSSKLNNAEFVKTYDETAEKPVLNKSLFSIPTSKKDNGDEVVVFDEKMLEEGSKKWLNIVCGYFVGYNMSPAELRYNIRRMSSKYGLYDIINNGISVWLFKFREAGGMNTIVDQSPWMVNEEPLMVHKWNPDVYVEKAEPSRIPVWIKLFNLLLEA
nr:reverse transcriptase domain, reverse transcriptase zinc-binding domain protein [Tanacetum cinerariifolium]